MRRHYKFNTYSYLWLLYVSPKKRMLQALSPKPGLGVIPKAGAVVVPSARVEDVAKRSDGRRSQQSSLDNSSIGE
ncbi:unannotated protein [freshwater metagenome]|uniref:Unannotated protein n=1 Tax=freshwater metagenome TaxID=449393 RepID=A0A6J7D4H7_9ZZZZ